MKKGRPSYQLRLQRRAEERALWRKSRKWSGFIGSKATPKPFVHRNSQTKKSKLGSFLNSIKTKFQNYSNHARRAAFQKKI